MASEQIEIRAAGYDDVDAVLALWRASGASPTSTDNTRDVEALIQGWPGALILACATDEIAASIIATFDGWRGNLYRLVVGMRFRRHGLARRMVAEGEAHLRLLGCRRITALVESDQPLSTAFWEASDYVRHPNLVRYYHALD